MASVTFSESEFRAMFPAFASETKYPDAVLQGYFDMATCYVENSDWFGYQDCLKQALYLMIAHIAAIATNVNSGKAGAGGVVTSAGIGDVNVAIQPPPIKSSFQYWLNQTPYGQQLLALLCAQFSAGVYYGGLPERSAFRKVGGVF